MIARICIHTKRGRNEDESICKIKGWTKANKKDERKGKEDWNIVMNHKRTTFKPKSWKYDQVTLTFAKI